MIYSSASRSSSDDETEDEGLHDFRGRAFSQSSARNATKTRTEPKSPSSIHRPDPHAQDSGGSTTSGSGLVPGRAPFTRSRSPAVRANGAKHSKKIHRHMSPSISRPSRQKLILPEPVTVMPAITEFRKCIPFTSRIWTLTIESRKSGESLLLLASLLYATYTLLHSITSQSTVLAPAHTVTKLWPLPGNTINPHFHIMR